MGAFLPKPVTDTFPFDDRNEKYAYGSSSMQGYRTSQEDAHLCLLDFDEDTCLFGVFDGHGGAEVAQYTSKKFPEFLRNNVWYKKQDYEKALREAFIEFDASLIKDEVYRELKILAGANLSSEEEDEDMPSNLAALKEEAGMPIRELMERIATGAMKERKSKLKAQKSIEESIANEQCSSSSKQEVNLEPCSSSKENGESSEKRESISSKEQVSTLAEENEAGCSLSDASSNKQAVGESTTQSDLPQEPSSTVQAESSSETEKSDKRRIKPTQISPKVSFLQMLDEIDDEEDSEDDSMEDDEDASDDSEMFDDSESELEESESDEEVEMDEANGLKSAKPIDQLRNFMFDEGPGKDSGCTAVIALLKGNKLYVANAGDSRAVLCRNGKAVEMSEDHKPTSEIEYARIKKAGGKVTQDGRVNGGLNLSRAFGDHSYKTNKDLPLDEQMITALPDIRTIDIQPEDDFIVIACDGIWNSMDSDEVVEYILNEMKKETKLSKICDSLFFKCLAEDTRGDGSGCDNQTCIIIKLRDLPEPEEHNGELKENIVEADSDEVEREIKIVNELSSLESNGKRKRDEATIAANSNGKDSLVESPSSKKPNLNLNDSTSFD